MQKYLCHKSVRAFKLSKIAGLRLIGENPEDFVDVSPAFFTKHPRPLFESGAASYVVVYENGYISLSPADVFEAGYDPVDEELMTEDEANAISNEEELEVLVAAEHKEPSISDR